MFGTSHSERSIAPTPRRLADARRLGDAPRSRDLTAAAAALGAAAALWLFGPSLWEAGRAIFHATWSAPLFRIDGPILPEPAADTVFRAAEIAVGILAVPVMCAVAAGLLPTRFQVVASLPRFRWSRVSPLAAWRRLGSARDCLTAGSTLAKLAATGIVVAWTAREMWPATSPAAAQASTNPAAALGELVAACGIRTALLLFVISVGDWWIQRTAFVRRWRMTPAELRDEARNSNSQRPRRTRSAVNVSLTAAPTTPPQLSPEQDFEAARERQPA